MVTFEYEEIEVIYFNLLNKDPCISKESFIQAFYKMFAFEVPTTWAKKAKKEWRNHYLDKVLRGL